MAPLVAEGNLVSSGKVSSTGDEDEDRARVRYRSRLCNVSKWDRRLAWRCIVSIIRIGNLKDCKVNRMNFEALACKEPVLTFYVKLS